MIKKLTICFVFRVKRECFIGAITSDVLNLVCLARKRTLGPFSPSFKVQDVLAEGLRKVRNHDVKLAVVIEG